MHSSLREIIRLTSFAKITGLKVIGSRNKTELSAVDEDRELIINVTLKEPIPEFEGTFGIPHLKLLDSLLGFEKYREGGVNVTRFKRTNRNEDGTESEVEVPQSIRFVDKRGASSTFWFNHGKSIPIGADTPRLGYDISFDPTKEAMAEFNKMAVTFSGPEPASKLFGAKVIDGDLRFSFGVEGSTTYYGDMVFEEKVKGGLMPGQHWSSAKFSGIMKAAQASSNPITLSLKDKLLRVSTETELGRYDYHLRTNKVA